MSRVNFNTTIDEGTRDTIKRLAVGGLSQGDVIDAAVKLLETQAETANAQLVELISNAVADAAPDPAILEILELARSTVARVDKLPAPADSPALLEILEHSRSQLDEDMVRSIISEEVRKELQVVIANKAASKVPANTGGFNPASIPGVQVGGYSAPLRQRESSADRAKREEAEREQRARARSSVGDDPSYVFDGEFVQD